MLLKMDPLMLLGIFRSFGVNIFTRQQKALQASLQGMSPKCQSVKELTTKKQGRPLLLGKELDKAVQECIEATRAVGGVINTAVVMGAAEGIISARDISKLSSHGGHITITKTWAKSLLI